ncbi:MAG: hypothetical protein ACT4QG_09605 [Sporichthyaceae bacterium]
MRHSQRVRRAGAMTMLLTMLAGLLGLAATAPASAHSGGKAVVLIRSLVVEPAGSGWQVAAVLTDNDSGDVIRGPKVTALVGETGAAKEITMTPDSGLARFVAALPAAKPGPLTLALKVRSSPGSDPVVPFNSQPFTAQLVSGESTTLVAGGGDGGSNLPLIMGVAAAVLAVSLLYGLYSVRRRTAVPVRTK